MSPRLEGGIRTKLRSVKLPDAVLRRDVLNFAYFILSIWEVIFHCIYLHVMLQNFLPHQLFLSFIVFVYELLVRFTDWMVRYTCTFWALSFHLIKILPASCDPIKSSTDRVGPVLAAQIQLFRQFDLKRGYNTVPLQRYRCMSWNSVYHINWNWTL